MTRPRPSAGYLSGYEPGYPRTTGPGRAGRGDWSRSYSLQRRAQRRRAILLGFSITMIVACAALLVHQVLTRSTPSSEPASQAQQHPKPGGGSLTPPPATDPSISTRVRPSATSHPLSPQKFSHPAVPVSSTSLAPKLVQRLRAAQNAARQDGVEIVVTSGWRSLAKQQQLYQEEIAKYGSSAQAKQWVLPPAESEHPRGRAIDIGPEAAGAWLQRHGSTYGLCRRYANEWWHFEPLVMPGQTCPALAKNAADSSIVGQ